MSYLISHSIAERSRIRTKRPTLRQIAEVAECSANTVSLALRNSPRISPQTRNRVQCLAKQLGYIPNPRVNEAMRYVRGNRQHLLCETLGVLVDWPTQRRLEVFEHPFYGKICSALNRRINALGCHADYLFIRNESHKNNPIGQILKNRGIRGFVALPFSSHETKWDIDLQSFSAIQIGRSIDQLIIDSVAPDDSMAIYLTTKKIFELGHRNLGFFFSNNIPVQTFNKIQMGILFSKKTFSYLNIIPSLIGDFGTQDKGVDVACLAASFISWFQKYKPEVIAGEVHILRPIIENNLKLKVPQDVGLVQIGHSFGLGTTFAGIDYQVEIQAEIAAESLVQKLFQSERQPVPTSRETIIPVTWVDGPTIINKKDSQYLMVEKSA